MTNNISGQQDDLSYTFATWVFRLHIAGFDGDDPTLSETCAAIDSAVDETAGNDAGQSLVNRVAELLQGKEPSQVMATAAALYGERSAGLLGEGTRDERTHRIRKYQFEKGLPWLARIWERNSEGEVGPVWLLVERMTDEVAAMDPNPWNDIDEDRNLPVGDFQVLWELDGCPSIHIV
ncbi:MAG: hypothetical protein HN348_20030 [Proteobacteria bacterium]|jgi:hypothetical protein|nr:hypothetical protein [Pseudomonadota bacterium]